MEPAGLALGVLIGVVSGFILILLLRTAVLGAPGIRPTLTVTGHLLAIPTFWFGGPWLTATVIRSIDLATIVQSYMVALACTFVAIALFPLFRLVIRLGNQIAQEESPR